MAGLLGRMPTPWERRAELGFFMALWLQWKETMIYPDRFWRTVHPGGAAQDALFYGWLMQLVGLLAGAPLVIFNLSVQQAIIRQMFSSSGSLPPVLDAILDAYTGPGGTLLMVVLYVVPTLMLYPLGLIIWASLVHLCCLIFGCARNGFWATFRVMGYASSPSVFMGLPLINIVAWVYNRVLEILGLLRVQETTGGRATLAVLAFPLLVLCCMGGLVIVAISAMFASFRP